LLFSSSTGTTGNSIHHSVFLKATEINYVVYYRADTLIRTGKQNREAFLKVHWQSSAAGGRELFMPKPILRIEDGIK